MSRPHNERLLANLSEIRKELTQVAASIPDSNLDWAPAAGMKSYRALLQEIGTMEKLCAHWLATGEMLDWDMPGHVPAQTTHSALSELGGIRNETVAYLKDVSEESLQTPIPVPESWQQYMGTQIEPEEVVRWTAQHEYYHLGQIISYRWMQGHAP